MFLSHVWCEKAGKPELNRCVVNLHLPQHKSGKSNFQLTWVGDCYIPGAPWLHCCMELFILCLMAAGAKSFRRFLGNFVPIHSQGSELDCHFFWDNFILDTTKCMVNVEGFPLIVCRNFYFSSHKHGSVVQDARAVLGVDECSVRKFVS